VKKSPSILIVFLCSLLVLQAESARDYYLQGETFFDQGDYYSAIEAYRESLDLNPHYLDALLQLSKSYFMIEEYQEAQHYIIEAQPYGQNNLDLMNMEGRIFIGKGDLDEAEVLFRRVILNEPNNLEANLGLAEVLLLKGNHQEGALAYRRSLILSPESKRALLSMLLLFDFQGEFEKAQIYLELALKYHSQDAQVFLQAAQHYLRSGDLTKALYYGENAVQMDSNLPGPDFLLAKIYYSQENYTAAYSALQRGLQLNPNDFQALFLMARCQEKLQEDENALVLYQRILKENPLDENARIHWEELLRRQGSSVATLISDATEYHLNRGIEYQNDFDFSHAQASYRRTRWLDPYYYQGWLRSSRLLITQGYPEEGLDSLRALKEAGFDDQELTDQLRMLEHSRNKGMADRWQLNQFQIPPNPYGLSLFFKPNTTLYHYSSEEALAGYFQYNLLKNNSLDLITNPAEISNYSQAFQRARDEESDYFIILEFSEGPRSFLLKAQLYLSRTGRLIDNFSILRMGSNRVQDSMAELSKRIVGFLLPRGHLVQLNDNQAIVNLGRMDGIEVDDIFQVIKEDNKILKAEEPWLEYPQEDLMGFIHIEEVDEAMSQGRWENHGHFEMIAPGEEAYLLEPLESQAENADTQVPWIIDQELKRQLLMLQ
jgi:tetratricopeptide (TPR) repeat protein